MVIKRIILHRYKRFSLKEVETFDYEPDSNLVIFKWGNGVGKSSLLQQLNPLPADLKKDFLEGGFKEIHIEHLGRNYVLISKDGKHNFIEDGVELNPGGTKKAQLELVEEKFKLNPNVLSVVNGYSRFTLMSPSDRKYWLTKISSVDYTYVIGIYNKLLEFKRDNTGTIKTSKESLAVVEKELIEIGDIKSVVEEQDKIRNVIEDLLKSYIYTKEVDELDTILNSIKDKIEEIRSNPIYRNKTNLEGVTDSSLEIKKNKLQDRLVYIFKEEERINKDLKLFDNKIDIEEISRLDRRSKELNTQCCKYISLINDMVVPEQVLKSSIDYISSLLDSYSSFNNSLLETNINKDDLSKDVSVELDSSNKELGGLLAIIGKANESSALLDKTIIKNVVCNSCGNSMPMSVIKDDLTSNIEKLDKRREELNSKIKKLTVIKSKQEALKNLEMRLKSLPNVSNLIRIINLYMNTDYKEDDILKFDMLKILQDRVVSCFNIIKDKDIPNYKELESVNKILKEEEIRSEAIKKLGGSKIESLKEELLNISKEKVEINKSLSLLTEFIKNFNSFNCILGDIRKLLSKHRKLQCETKKMINNKTIELIVTDLKGKLSELNKLTDKRKELEVKLKMLTTTIIDKEDSNAVLNILLKILSPTNGLIAKSVNSFIGKIIHDMNLIINSVWTYKMKLLPCEISETSDLDYKLRVEVNDSFIVEDISKLSSSMQEIVDLAFRIVFIKYMDFHTVPIILDEFGRTMDQEHRIQAFNMIDEVICKTYDQVFLVSHFEEMYGRFKNASFPEMN